MSRFACPPLLHGPWTRALWSPLLRAGAFGALRGGHPGYPALGVTVPVPTPGELGLALERLSGTGAHVTLLCPPALARTAPDLLRAATRAGHEIAGDGLTRGAGEVALLQTVAGQQVTAWRLRPSERNGAALRTLAAWDIHPLPPALPAPEPGGTAEVSPADLRVRLDDWRARGYRPVPVRELPGLRAATPADLAQHVYMRLVEDRFSAQSHLIDLTQRADGVMRIAPLDHAPPPLPFPPRTPTAELHLHSPRVVGLAARSPLTAYRAYARSWGDVARALQTRPELAQAQVIFGVTLLFGPLEKAGFTVVELPPLQAHWYGLGFRLLRLAYGTARPPSEGLPKMAWMTREAFLARHGGAGTESGTGPGD